MTDDQTPPEELESTEVDPATPAAPERIGPYRLLQKIGEGGMGEVYLAEQAKPIRRRVALKIIKRGMDTDRVIARFEAERQALAMMNHPNVAKVFDAGATERGRPYFAMEYVKGESITKYCDKQRLTTQERLKLFMQICEGIQHAHQKAIIHRDIKPSNVLVAIEGEKPVPKIIDFGVAKAVEHRLTEKTLFTELGQLIGTPEYMSPEQAEMTTQDIDTRTDVYSLGVVLYELLVGALPFDSRQLREAGFDEIRRRIREEEPSKPSTRISTLGGDASTEVAKRRGTDLPTLRRQLRSDLDWITMRALEKDRTRRYGSPSEIAADILRHLKHEPVVAGPPSAAYRTRKFVRRHTIGVAFAATLAAILIGFGVGMSVLYARAVEAELLAEGRRADAEQARDEAEVVTQFLSDMLAAVNPTEQGVDVKVRQVLDQASGEIAEKFDDKPLIEARLRDTIGDSYAALGLSDPAESHLRAALQLRRNAFGNEHVEVLDSIESLGSLLFDRGHHDEAERLGRERIEILEQMFGPDDFRLRVAQATLAQILQRKADSDTAERETMDMALNYVLTTMDPELYDPDLADNIRRTRRIASEQGRDEARLFLTRYWRETTARIADLATNGQLDAARIEVRRHFDPLLSNAILRPYIPMMMLANADYLVLRGNLAAAQVFSREALRLVRNQLGNEHVYVSYALAHLGRLLRRTGELTESGSLLRQAADMQRMVLGKEHPDLAGTLISLGGLLREKEEFADAERAFREALRIRRDSRSKDPKLISSSLLHVGSCLLAQQRYGEAETVLLEGLELRRSALPEGDWKIAEVLGALGESLAGQGKFEQAEGTLVDAYESLLEAAEKIPADRGTLLYDSVERVVDLYDSWSAADPEGGYADKAAGWRAKLPERDEG